MIEKLIAMKPILTDWHNNGKNYAPAIDYVDANELAIHFANKPFNIGCSSCRVDLATFILELIKDKGL